MKRGGFPISRCKCRSKGRDGCATHQQIRYRHQGGGSGARTIIATDPVARDVQRKQLTLTVVEYADGRGPTIEQQERSLRCISLAD